MNEEQNNIATRVIGVMKAALTKYAAEGKNDGITPKDTQILIALRPDPNSGNLVPYYRVWKNMAPYMRARKIKEHPGSENTDEVTFKNILGVKLDFRGMEETSKMFLVDTFARMQKELTEALEKGLKDHAGKPVLDPEGKPFEEIMWGYYEDESQPKSYVPSLEIFIVSPTDSPVNPDRKSVV